ncbi:MAG TPA: ATPase [Candidatus Blautia stercoripullorum]|uniref:ATPase n=1 Tax=Candidatus Blautia stercoripullorum TaxID=2838502 RepID=A0A9D2RCL1_9FIRM|nr:ATPase [Candidatus Blautia stercoripullorum]
MIEKMKFLSITGPKADIDRVVNDYLSKYEIHLENAMAQLTQVQHLSPYIQINPYRDLLAKVNEFASLLGDQGNVPIQDISLEEIQPLLDSLGEKISELRQECDRLMAKQTSVTEDINRLFPFSSLPEDVDKLIHYRFVQVRFGRIQKEYYEKFNTYVYDDLDTMFYPCREDSDYVWGLYFVLWTKMEQVDAVFSSMHFERIYLKKDFYHGTPQALCSKYNRKLEELQRQYDKRQEEIQNLLKEDASMILSAQAALNALSTNFDVRKVAACVKEHQETFYILCGWMTENDASAFMKAIEDDPKLFCVIEDDKNKISCKPPTKLKNPKIFKPFEMYVKMYGLPDYHEMDPTIFVAVTYSFIFGVMFGDVGQGLLLALGGFFLYKKKHLDLAAIIGTAGIFSTFFGFMFGSVFGFEDIIDAVWLRPAEAMTLVPGLGNMNTIFVVAIIFGMFLILLTMVFHVINAVKTRDVEGTWFDQNAVCGLVFYGTLTASAILLLTGNPLPAAAVLIVLFAVPLILIMLKEPITRLVEKKTPAIEGSKPMFFVQSFFELFEIMLSFLSNTLSFVRIGAFAVSHAAMMGVVLMLAGAEGGGSINWIIIVLGNLFVCAMEGLIVGIQVLRLEYYEMFSRFYKGSGKEFRPFLKRVNQKSSSDRA